MYAITDITGTLVLDWVQRSTIGKFDSMEINANKAARGATSIPALAIDEFSEAADSCGVDLESLDPTQTEYVNGALLWKIAGNFAYEEIQAGKNCDDCESTHDDFRKYACRQAETLMNKVSECMSKLLGFDCYTSDDLPSIFSMTSYSDCECP